MSASRAFSSRSFSCSALLIVISGFGESIPLALKDSPELAAYHRKPSLDRGQSLLLPGQFRRVPSQRLHVLGLGEVGDESFQNLALLLRKIGRFLPNQL